MDYNVTDQNIGQSKALFPRLHRIEQLVLGKTNKTKAHTHKTENLLQKASHDQSL